MLQAEVATVILIASFISGTDTNAGRDAALASARVLDQVYDLNTQFKQLERRYTPEFLRQYGGAILVLHNVLVQKQISFTYEF